MILDFTGVGIILGFLLTAIMLLLMSFIILAVCLVQKSKTSKLLSNQNAYKFARSALIFFAVNMLGFGLALLAAPAIPYDMRKWLDGLMIIGWLPVNLLAVFIAAPIIQRKIDAIEI